MSFRRALGAVKDQTSIGLVKVSSSLAPDLEVAIVKATSHVEEPPAERHVREILAFTSYSRAYVSACVDKVSRRLTKTRDWVVALKSLSLVHRLLSDGDAYFQLEILRSTRLLNLSDFRDEAHSNSWDLSAFVRSYALYLDQRLECALHDSKISSTRSLSQHERSASTDTYDASYRSHLRSTRSFDADRERERERERERRNSPSPPAARDLTTEVLLARMHHLQLLLDRFLACRPTGRAKSSRMVLVALHPVVGESFKIYADLCELLSAFLDRFFDMEYPHCVKAFESYAAAAKQIDELVKFYAWCRDVGGVARSSEFPEVQQITDKLLDTLEEFMRDKARGGAVHKSPPPAAPVEEPPAAEEDINSIKALPAPEGWKEDKEEEEEKKPEEPVPEPAPETKEKPQQTADLVDLREDTGSADDQGNRLALALFSGPSNGTSWNSSDGDNPDVTSAGKADWELALVESAGNLARQRPALAGGFDPLLLDGMYDQGIVRQHVSNAQVTAGSASSVALPLPGLGRGSNPVLALPAPDGSLQTVGQLDPFAASLSVPPPSYVQMADIEKKRQLLLQEKVTWEQYARDGMQGQASLAKLSMGYNYAIPAAVPYGMPPVNGGGYSYHYPQYTEYHTKPLVPSKNVHGECGSCMDQAAKGHSAPLPCRQTSHSYPQPFHT